MPKVICTDDYLSEMVLLHKGGYHQAARLVRCQIITGNRNGHILHLDTEFRRRHITYDARLGRISHIIVDCARCGCQAWLDDWVRASELTLSQVTHRMLSLPIDTPEWRMAFMRHCGGNKAYGATLQTAEAALLPTTL